MRFETLGAAHLRSGGGGGDPAHGLCVMELVDLLSGSTGRLTDRPQTACPVLTEFAIALNDCAPSTPMRDTLKPLALTLLNTRTPDLAWERVDYIVRAAARRLVAPCDAIAARRMLGMLDQAEPLDGERAARVALILSTEISAYTRRRKATAHHPLSPAARWRELRAILNEAALLGAPAGYDDAPALAA